MGSRRSCGAVQHPGSRKNYCLKIPNKPPGCCGGGCGCGGGCCWNCGCGGGDGRCACFGCGGRFCAGGGTFGGSGCALTMVASGALQSVSQMSYIGCSTPCRPGLAANIQPEKIRFPST